MTRCERTGRNPRGADEPGRRWAGAGSGPLGLLWIGLVVALATVASAIAGGAAGAATVRSRPVHPVARIFLGRSTVAASGGGVVVSLRTLRATSCRIIAPAPVVVLRRWVGCRDGLVRTVARFPANERAVVVRRPIRVLVTGPGGRAVAEVVVVEAGAKAPPAPPIASLTLSSASLPATGGAFTLAFSSNNAASCTLGVSPALWSGPDPAKVSCNGGYQGTVPATPTGARQWGFTFTARSTKGRSTSSSQVLTEAAVPVSVTTSSLPAATLGIPYAATLLATGGTAPYTWAVSGGPLPVGLSLSASGTISGTPSVAGPASFSVQVSDSAVPTAGVATASFSVSVLGGGFAGATTPNWSGYVLPSGTQIFTEASGAWTVPTLDCAVTPNAGAATWVGIGGFGWSSGGSSGVLLQSGVTSSCVNGVQQDVGWWEEFPSNPNYGTQFTGFPVSPGDSIVASVDQTSSGAWQTRVDDLSTGLSGWMVTGQGWGVASDASNGAFTEQGSTSGLTYSGGYSAEWIVEDAESAQTGTLVPFADYGSVAFANLTTSLSSWSLTPSEAVQLVQGGVVLSSPSQPGSGTFSVSYTG